jgi:DNA repair protein RadC
LTDGELVSIFLGEDSGNPEFSAEALLRLFGGLQGLAGFDLEMSRAQRLTDRQTVFFLAAVELGRRLHQRPDRPLHFADPSEVAAYLAGHYRAASDQQVLGVLFADSSGRGLGLVECFRGTQLSLNIDTKPILREALCRNATALLVFCFRPSAKPEANSQDFEFRKNLSVACGSLGVELLDFLLLSSESWLSLRRLKPW